MPAPDIRIRLRYPRYSCVRVHSSIVLYIGATKCLRQTAGSFGLYTLARVDTLLAKPTWIYAVILSTAGGERKAAHDTNRYVKSKSVARAVPCTIYKRFTQGLL